MRTVDDLRTDVYNLEQEIDRRLREIQRVYAISFARITVDVERMALSSGEYVSGMRVKVSVEI